MKSKLSKIITFIIASIISLSAFISLPTFADIDCESIKDTIAYDAAGCGQTKDSLPNLIKNIINAIIGVLGIVAVIVIIIGGITFMTSSGDAGKVKKAKDTILYAAIGLIVCVLSYIIVNWVIGIL